MSRHHLPMLALIALLACDPAGGKDDTGGMEPAVDLDGDGHDSTVDCDDDDPAVHPGASEECNGVDDDCDGFVDDADPDLSDAEVWYADTDGDGYGDSDAGVVACHQPSRTVADSDDCDDADAAVFPGADEHCNGVDDDCDGEIDEEGALDAPTWSLDYDGDGFGGDSYTTQACSSPGEAWVSTLSDCDDLDATVYPGADERCDGQDNDCDMAVDEDPVDATTWYADADGDSFGDPARGTAACDQPSGTVAGGGDCDDTDAAIHPAAAEICDGIDNDCDTLVDDADPSVVGAIAWYADSDGDGFGSTAVVRFACTAPSGFVASSGDCDDADAAVSPDADEVCDGSDNDCDGVADEPDAVDATTWYADMDGDGYGDATSASVACSAPSRHVADATDCDDGVAAINPAGTETCSGVDDDCDGLVDDDDPSVTGTGTWYADADGDGFGDPATAVLACGASSGVVASSSDCDDGDAAVNPGASEVCDGLDNDCDGLVDGDDGSLSGGSSWYLDADLDGYGDASSGIVACSEPSGYVSGDTDCDDGDPDVNPGATEECNGYDDDCDGLVDGDDTMIGSGLSIWYFDADGDGWGDPGTSATACSAPSFYVSDGTDCDDLDPGVNPGASEACNGVDDDCDGTVDSSSVCPCNLHRQGDHVYLFCTTVLDWYDAREDCLDQDGYDLTTIDDSSEQSWVYTTLAGYSTGHWWWIGYNDIDASSSEEPDSAWEWADGSTSTYTNWDADQPDDWSSDEDCGHIYGGSGLWNDMTCDWDNWYGNDMYFICESG